MPKRTTLVFIGLLLVFGLVLLGFNLWAFQAFNQTTAAVDATEFPLPARFYVSISGFLADDPIAASARIASLIKTQIAIGAVVVVIALGWASFSLRRPA